MTAERPQRDSAAQPAAPFERATPAPSAAHLVADNAPTALPAMAGLPAPHTAPRYEAAAVAQAHIGASPDTPAFAPALATQVRWFVENGVPQAQLNLHPAEMGPVAVRIVLEGTQARIDFTADLAATRGAIESSLPALAASLAEGGLTLAGGGVFDGSPSQQQQQHGGHPHAHPATRAAIGRDATDEAQRTADDGGARRPNGATTRGLVDLVA
jgi:flagellar hook-length control protein FliK